MAKGRNYGSERRLFEDEETGAKIVRVSGFPTINHHVYMHSRCFTCDSRDVVFYSYRQMGRDSPRDIFAASVDGMNLRQLTNGQGAGWMNCSPVDRSVFYSCGDTLRKVDVDGFEEKTVARSPPGLSFGIFSISGDGKKVLSESNVKGEGILFAVDLVRESVEEVYRHPGVVGHLQVEPASSRWAMFTDAHPSKPVGRIWCIRLDGTDPRMIYDGSHGKPSHLVWWPGQDAAVSTLQHPDPGIIRIGLDGKVDMITDAQFFWHAGASLDGTMLCSDTFVPDTGMYLVNPNNGANTRLCYPRSNEAHPQWTHPHPSWSPDGKMVVFTSDREGLPHVFVVRVPDDLRP